MCVWELLVSLATVVILIHKGGYVMAVNPDFSHIRAIQELLILFDEFRVAHPFSARCWLGFQKAPVLDASK